MLAVSPSVVAAVAQAVSALIPEHVGTHPCGAHNPRTPDEVCFRGLLAKVVTGCSWVVAGFLVGVPDAVLHRRRDGWVGAFDQLVEQALAGYDRIIGLRVEDPLVDGSLHKAPWPSPSS